MTREERLKQCRFYKGEKRFEDTPPEVKNERFAAWFWMLEEIFVNHYEEYLPKWTEAVRKYRLMDFKVHWEGKVSDEMITFLFPYFTKVFRYRNDSAALFVSRELPRYIGSTSM